MELFDTPYMVRVLASNTLMTQFGERFRKLNERDNKASAKLMKRMSLGINRLKKRIETDDGSPEYRAANDKLLRAKALADVVYRHINGSRHRLASVVYLVKITRHLGIQRNLGKLRAVMRVAEAGVDFADSTEFINGIYGIQRCQDCHQWEYTERVRDTYDETKICRDCADNSYVYSEVEGTLVHGEESRQARDADGLIVTIHQNNEDYLYNDERDLWHHRDYVFPPPPVLGTYHQSKSQQAPIRDEWSDRYGRYYGVELEVEIRNYEIDRAEKAIQLNRVVNEGQVGRRAFFETDGSLSNGFEIITQPMSLPMHRQFWNWLNDREATKSLLSHNTSTCGLHVHVSRDGLTTLTIAKVVTFVNHPDNKVLITAVARRYAEGYCKIKTKDLKNALSTTDRYEAVNVTSRRTIEFRIFKGSLKYESVLSAIEFCHALVEFAKSDTSEREDSLRVDQFIDFLNNQAVDETANLRPYLNQRLEMA